MEEKAETPRKYPVPAPIDMNAVKNKSAALSLPPSPKVGSAKPSSARLNCLCSPTTHVGSFRCRHHRNRLARGGSVGSNLSYLAAKTAAISDSLQA